MNQYRFQRSFLEDPTLSSRLFNLVEVVFPEIINPVEYARKLGASWEDASTPFVRFHDDIAITHVGVLEIPMQLMGEMVTVAGVHGVCTHPEFRRRGYYREVMQEVLDYCDKRYKTQVLTTSQPELYEPFGFRFVQEHMFISKCKTSGGTHSLRLLNTSNIDDVKLLHRLLETREPVSNILGIVKEKAVFCVNEGTNPLYYAEDLDVILSIEIEETKLKLFDLLRTKICTLEAILARIPQPLTEVEIYFSPDRLDADVQAFPHRLNGNSFLMVRGEFAPEWEKFMIPRSTRC